MTDTTTAAPSVQQVLHNLEQIVPFLAEKASETERNRAVLPEVIEAIEDTGYYSLPRPKHHNGLEASFVDIARAQATIARGCPSTGWVAALHGQGPFWFAMFPEEAQEELFADKYLRVSGSLAPTGTGERRPGGAVINGRWAWHTGNSVANWHVLAMILTGNDGIPEPAIAVVPTSQVQRIDDWYAFGMAGTGSNTVFVEDVFVPEHRILPIARLLLGDSFSERTRKNPYFKKPGVAVIVAGSVGPTLGMAEGAYDAFLERLPGRMITYTNYGNQAEAPVTHLQLAQAKMKLEQSRLHAYRSAQLLDEMDSTASIEARYECRAHTVFSVISARECVEELYRASGASVIMSNVALQRYHRDMQAVSQHGFFTPASTLESYGRVLLGLDPNSAFC